MNRLLAIATFVATGCAPEAIPEVDAFECVDDNSLCASLAVPSGYDGTARELFIGFYSDDNFNRPPDSQLNPVADPTVAPGEVYEFSRDGIEVSGDYYMMFVLYDIDGGNFIPEAGIDCVAETARSYTFDGSPIQIEDLELTYAE